MLLLHVKAEGWRKIMGDDGVQIKRFQIKKFHRLFLTLSNILSFNHSFIIAPL